MSSFGEYLEQDPHCLWPLADRPTDVSRFRATDNLNAGGWFALNKRPGEALWLLPE
jgi:hypothetical protein